MVVVIILLVALLVLVVTGVGLMVSRRRRADLLEPPPTAPRIPREVREQAEVWEDEAEARADADLETPLRDGDSVAGAIADELDQADADALIAEAEAALVEAPEELVKPRFRDRLSRARNALSGAFGSIGGRGKIDEETWEELEEALILADLGVAATDDLLEHLRSRVKADGITDGEQLLDALKSELKARLDGYDRDLHLSLETGPTVWLFVGVNGVGKTTTIGKVGARETADGLKVVMAAGDTFRAAAAEQLGMWAERAGAELVRGSEGGDPSAVIYDAVDSANARGYDLVLADTAGRLHTKVNLMEELRKVRRVADGGAGTVTEVLLVLDATTGQNGLVQAQQFTEAVEVTGVVLTKLDGSAKGGIVVAIHAQLGIPVKLVGLGEGAGDLVPFDPDEFVEALFA
ncbi:MAG TPA: signal recognition particle-docking protein FtsY [Acidimicrobiales bacterium]